MPYPKIPGVPSPEKPVVPPYEFREYPKDVTVDGFVHTVHNPDEEAALHKADVKPEEVKPEEHA